MNILVIGCGRTGRSIVEGLLDIKYVDSVFLYSRTSKSAKALAYDLGNKKVFVSENMNNLRNIDYVVIALSGMSDNARLESIQKRASTYHIRQDELKFNIGAISELIKHLKKLPSASKIIVITNPVDEITNYLRMTLNNNNVLGFGLELDAKRYSKLLGKNVLCIGTHGKAVPILNLNSDQEYSKLSSRIDTELMGYIREHGIPNKAAGISFKEFFERLTGNKKDIVLVSNYISKPFYGLKGISISLPFECQEGKIIGIADFKPNHIELNRFKKSVLELQNSVKHILETHKKLISYK